MLVGGARLVITIIIPGCEFGNGTRYNLVAVQLASKPRMLPFTGVFREKLGRAALVWWMELKCEVSLHACWTTSIVSCTTN